MKSQDKKHNIKETLKIYAVVNVRRRKEYNARKGKYIAIVGGNGEGAPPVLIPNTEVKTLIAESTWLDTAREDMTPPTSRRRRPENGLRFLLRGKERRGIRCAAAGLLLRLPHNEKEPPAAALFTKHGVKTSFLSYKTLFARFSARRLLGGFACVGHVAVLAIGTSAIGSAGIFN